MTRELERFRAEHPRSLELAEEAGRTLLGGVPMHWMVRWPGGFPVFAAHAEGARVTDVDGHEYVDLCLGDTGAMAGHALPQVTAVVAARMARGATVMLPSDDAVWVGDELTRRFGLPSWQLAMSATDANRFVLRFARHLTGRPRVAVMDWCYHGTVDETLAVLDASGAVVPRPGALGPQVDVALTTAVVPFNDVDAIDRRLAEGDVACLLLEERTDVKAYSRANNLWARPQELLAGIGLREALAENSYAIHTINFFVNGTPTKPIPIADVASPYPKVLYSGQDVIERTLTAEFEARGGQLDDLREAAAVRRLGGGGVGRRGGGVPGGRQDVQAHAGSSWMAAGPSVGRHSR